MVIHLRLFFFLKMKFLIIHNRYSRTGGEESVVAFQKQLLLSHGHQVTLYERSYAEIRQWRLGRVASFFSALYNRRSVREISQILDRESFDAAIVHNLFPVISPAILPILRKRGIKVLMSLHNYRLICPTGLCFTSNRICEKCGAGSLREFNCTVNRCEGSLAGSFAYSVRSYVARIRGSYIKNVDYFLALSEFQKQKLIQYGYPASKIKILSNALDLSTMPISKVGHREDFIGFVGRLSPEKGVDLLLEVARRLPNLRFRIAGELAERCSIDNLPQNVELLGLLNRDQLADFYSSARAILTTSRCWEGFSLTTLEAMYYNTTVVVPRWAAFPEMVADGVCGMLYEPCSADSIIEALENLRDFDTLPHQRVAQHYNAENYYLVMKRESEEK